MKYISVVGTQKGNDMKVRFACADQGNYQVPSG